MLYKRPSGYVLVVIGIIFSTQLCSDAFATSVHGLSYINIEQEVGQPYPISGPAAVSESYSLVDLVDDYAINNTENVPAETSVSTVDGSSNSLAVWPYFLAGQAGGWADSETYGSKQSSSWFSVTRTGLTGNVTDLVTFWLSYDYELILPTGSEGNVIFYFAVWQGAPEDDNLLLTAKDGWNVVNLGVENSPFNVVSKTFSSGFGPIEGISWSIPIVTGQEYSYYVSCETNVIPEPTTILLFAFGGLMLRKRRA